MIEVFYFTVSHRGSISKLRAAAPFAYGFPQRVVFAHCVSSVKILPEMFRAAGVIVRMCAKCGRPGVIVQRLFTSVRMFDPSAYS